MEEGASPPQLSSRDKTYCDARVWVQDTYYVRLPTKRVTSSQTDHLSGGSTRHLLSAQLVLRLWTLRGPSLGWR